MSAATAPIVVADHGWQRIGDWEQIAARAPQLAATVDAYLVELGKTLTPSSVKAAGAYETTARRAVPIAGVTRSHDAGQVGEQEPRHDEMPVPRVAETSLL